GHHLQDRADVLGQPAVDEDQAVGEPAADRVGRLGGPQDGVARQQAAAADAELGVAVLGGHPLDELEAGPDAAGVLPAAAGAAQPLAEDGAGGDQAALGLAQGAGQGGGL